MPVPEHSKASPWMFLLLIPLAFTAVFGAPLRAQDVSLQAIVTPSTVVLKDGQPVTFALHGFSASNPKTL